MSEQAAAASINSGKRDAENDILLKDLNQSDPELEKDLRYSAIFYLIVFIIVGIPVWYFTTTTYRADLPFSDIEALASNQIEYTILIDLVYFNAKNDQVKFDKVKLAKYEQELFTNLYKHSSLANGFRILYKGKGRLANENEVNFASKSTTLKEFDENILKESNLNQLRIFVFDEIHSKKFNVANNEIRFLNYVYASHDSELKNVQPLVDLITKQYLNINELIDIYKVKRDARRKAPTKTQLKQVHFDSDYEVTFSLINSKPEQYKINFNIESSINSFFKPILSQLSPYLSVNIKSQKLYYTEFDTYSIKYKQLSDKDGYYYLNPSDLSIMTNYIESRLGSQIQQNSTINFVTYVPTKQPLRILNANSELLNAYNAFLVPRWGGIYIYNHLNEPANQDMQIFLTQFLQLIGVDLHEKSRNEPRSKLYNSEIFTYLISKTLENVLNSMNTLESLASLLEKISNMVVGDDIAKQVHLSVDSIKKCLDLLHNGKIIEAFHASKTAYTSSENAFFDPSLLELLYFPEDQKFAIYIPLFIPVGLPLLMSFKSLFKWYKKRKADQKAKKE